MFVFNSVTVVSMHGTHVAAVPLFGKKVPCFFLPANQPVYPSILESNPTKATLIQVNVFLSPCLYIVDHSLHARSTLPCTLDPGPIGSLQALQVQRTPLAGK